MGIWSRIFARTTTEQKYPHERRVAYSGRTLAGILVTPDTAVTVPTVWACLRYLSQTVAVPPWHVMKEGRSGGEQAKTHPVDWLLYKRPNPEWSSFQFRETLTHWALRWGNGYAEIERDTLGRPLALWPIHPDRVDPRRGPSALNPSRPENQLYYLVNNGTDGPSELEMMDMFHIRGFGEGPVGVNVMHYAAESIGWARAAQLFGAAFFGNGMNVGGVIEMQKPLDEPGIKRLLAKFNDLYRGVRNSNKVVPLDNGMTFKQVGIEPEKAQFLATNQHLVEEICRWFGVPPHKVAHLLRATFSNIEHQSIEVVVDSVTPWVKRFEDEADFKLFGQNRPGLYTKMNLNALLRGDSAARGAFYKMMREAGAYSANDILRREDENTIGPEGDKRIVPMNMTTLERIGEEPAPNDAGGTPAAKPATSADHHTDAADGPSAESAVERIRAILETADAA